MLCSERDQACIAAPGRRNYAARQPEIPSSAVLASSGGQRMAVYLAKRIALALVTLWIISLIVF
jgi:hypothetical protein